MGLNGALTGDGPTYGARSARVGRGAGDGATAGSRSGPGALAASIRRFTCDPASVPAARRFVADLLVGLPRDQLDGALVVVSELAANCVLHARVPFTVQVDRTIRGARIEVADDATGMPAPRRPEPYDEGGRGLLLVEAMSEAWGVEARRDGGKLVWAEVGPARGA